MLMKTESCGAGAISFLQELRSPTMKARAPFASILIFFKWSCTRMCFLSPVTDFAESAHIHTTVSEMEVNYQ